MLNNETSPRKGTVLDDQQDEHRWGPRDNLTRKVDSGHFGEYVEGTVDPEAHR